MQWRDVSIPMHPEMVVWPGDAPFQFAPDQRIARGASCNTSVITCSTHTGTHCDAPWHFEETGRRLDEVDSELFFGDALVMDLPAVDRIRDVHLGTAPLPKRLLFKTSNSDYPAHAPFKTDYVALDASAAERLAAEGVRLVGVDYLSVAPYKQSGQETHHILLRNGIFAVEGLRLKDIPAGVHPFIVLPMPIAGADGAPCRAFVYC